MPKIQTPRSSRLLEQHGLFLTDVELATHTSLLQMQVPPAIGEAAVGTKAFDSLTPAHELKFGRINQVHNLESEYYPLFEKYTLSATAWQASDEPSSSLPAYNQVLERKRRTFLPISTGVPSMVTITSMTCTYIKGLRFDREFQSNGFFFTP